MTDSERQLLDLAKRHQRENPSLDDSAAMMAALDTSEGRQLYHRAYVSPSGDDFGAELDAIKKSVENDVGRIVKARTGGDDSPEAITRWLATYEGRRWYARHGR